MRRLGLRASSYDAMVCDLETSARKPHSPRKGQGAGATCCSRHRAGPPHTASLRCKHAVQAAWAGRRACAQTPRAPLVGGEGEQAVVVHHAVHGLDPVGVQVAVQLRGRTRRRGGCKWAQPAFRCVGSEGAGYSTLLLPRGVVG